MSTQMAVPDSIINIKDGDSILLVSADDRNEANRLQIKYAKIVTRWRQAKRLSIAVRYIPDTGTWGVFLEPRKN